MLRNSRSVSKQFKSPFTSSPSTTLSARVKATLTVPQQISELRLKEAELDKDILPLDLPDHTPPSQLLNEFIQILHTYNETKDVAQRLMGMLANQEGLTLRQVALRYDAPTE